LEKALAGVWTEVLGVDKVGRNDNFFDLGGQSLSAVQITFKIRQTFNVGLPLKAFLEAPVLSDQAQQVERELLSQADANELERLIDEIDPIGQG
jgi:acyl carrier protein